jgi:tetratricopeptide (TPR) repeat protein
MSAMTIPHPTRSTRAYLAEEEGDPAVANVLAQVEAARRVGRAEGVAAGLAMAEAARVAAELTGSDIALAAANTTLGQLLHTNIESARALDYALAAVLYATRGGSARWVARSAALAANVALYLHATQDMQEFVNLAKEAAVRAGDSRTLFNLCVTTSEYELWQGHFDAAVAALEAAREHMRDDPLAGPTLAANIALAQGTAALSWQRIRHPRAPAAIDAAYASAELAVALARETQHARQLHRAQGWLASAHLLKGAAPLAHPLAKSALEGAVALQDGTGRVAALMHLARVEIALGLHAEALAHYHECTHASALGEYYMQESDAYVGVADLLEAAGDLPNALVALRAAIAVKDRQVDFERHQRETVTAARRRASIPPKPAGR